MPDYNKLTVVKLREELVRRGLPKTGLKPVLVSRLLEADAQTEIHNATPDGPVSDVPAAKEESQTQVEPPHLLHTHHAQDRGGADQTSANVDLPEHKITRTSENDSLQERDPPEKSSGTVRENERDSNAPAQPELQPSAVVQEVIMVEKVTPGFGAFVGPQLENNAYSANLPGADFADAAVTESAPPTGEALLEIKSRNQASDQTQESIQTTVFSHPPEPRSLEQAATEPAGIIAAHNLAENILISTPSEQWLPENVPEEALQVIEANQENHMPKTPEKEEAIPAESIKVVEVIHGTTASDDLGKNIQEVQEQDPTRQPGVDEKSGSSSTLQDEEARPPIIAAEALEDNKKRKRRSQSPPLLTEDIAQKRARMDDSKLSVILPEDSLMRDVAESEGKEPKDISMVDPVPSHSPENDHPVSHTQSPQKETAGDQKSNPKEENEAPQPRFPSNEPESPREKEPQPSFSDQNPIQTQSEDTTGKPSPHDTRFKKLFGAPPIRSGSPDRQAAYREDEDRSVSPALHLATCALYIRNFMRPLHPAHLKDHLVALATPATLSPSASPSASPSLQVITEFFLDPIRTHCLVGFTSTAAASRVRSSLHNRVWPDERTRRPLWVDFVPEEKLQKWIEVEKDVGSQRGHGAKRWEVVYEEEEGHIKAYLQEAGPGSGPPPSHPSSRPKPDTLHAPPGVTGAPLGPRSRAIEAPRPIQQQKQILTQQGDVGKGFQALDDLFQSTTAKPKLYYLPVSKAVADKRLKQLEEGKGGGRSGNEIRKYTFEGEILVDRGAEPGGRLRGGYGGWTRGRGGGGGGGGGGGYRGEGWRERDRQRDPYDARERDEGLRERARREAWREKDRGDTFRERERERDRPGAWRERERDGGWRGAR